MNAIRPTPQMSLETILKQNADEAHRLRAEAASKLDENERIEKEMHAILRSVPPSGTNTMPVSYGSTEMTPEKAVCFQALAIVRSWKRRHKKNYNIQETELMEAVERLTWA